MIKSDDYQIFHDIINYPDISPKISGFFENLRVSVKNNSDSKTFVILSVVEGSTNQTFHHPSSSDKSFKLGFIILIRFSFFFLVQPFSCFSRAIASSTCEYSS